MYAVLVLLVCAAILPFAVWGVVESAANGAVGELIVFVSLSTLMLGGIVAAVYGFIIARKR